MNSSERVLAAMRCEPVDRIPFVPNLNGYAIRSMPERYHTMRRWDILRELGIDLLVRFRTGVRHRPPVALIPPGEGPDDLGSCMARAWAGSQPTKGGLELRTSTENGTEYVILDTPRGSLRCGWRFMPTSPDLPFPVEPLLKKPEDLDIYHYVLDHTVMEPAYEELESTLAAVGDEGTCEASGTWTPMQDMIEFLLGVENFYYFMNDYPDQMRQLMEHMHELRLEQYRILAKSPAPIVITGENTSTTLASPTYMAEWEFPMLNEYSDIVHREGKIHMAHMCGHLSGALDLLVASHLDGIHDAAPPPTGDLDFAVARERLSAAGKCLGGGIDPNAFVGLAPDELEEYVENRLDQVAPGTGFLMGCADTVPFGTTPENLRAVVRALERHGQYPLPGRNAD